jgi:hypothetical protein
MPSRLTIIDEANYAGKSRCDSGGDCLLVSIGFAQMLTQLSIPAIIILD